MATATPPISATPTLSMEEYLHSSYHPDCDFVDGHLEERTMGTPKHALLQMELGIWFGARRKEWNIRVMGDVRTRTTPTRVRLPDVAIFYAETPVEERVMTTSPLIAIEILSPEDRLDRLIVRLQEFVAMGVPHVWLLDPIERAAFIYTATGLQLVDSPRLALSSSPIYLDLPELFSALD